MKYKANKKLNRGQSLVEFTLVLPILMMLLLGLLDFGRAFFTLVALHDAADEGATYAAVRPNDVTGIRARAAAASEYLISVEPSDINVTYPPQIEVGAPITVTATYTLDLYTPFVKNLVGDNGLVLRGRSTHAIISVR